MDGSAYQQPLRWQGRWYTELAGGLYDFRARTWSPELGAFLEADEFGFLTSTGTLWSWPGQNPYKWRDPSGRLPWLEVAFPFLAVFDAANVAGAAVTAANVLTPGASTGLRWNSGNPIVLLQDTPWTFGNEGLTLGHVVALEGNEVTNPQTLLHELAHVEQHDVLGPAYLQLHGLAQVYSLLTTGSYRRANPLETGPYSNPPCPF